MVTVTSVVSGSVADKAGILKGDILISVNGHEIADVLDYRFYITEEKLALLIHRGAELLTVSVEKEQYDDLGLAFASYLMSEKTSCRNGCVFCFIDQNPPGMRETIYFKDDDSRLSFLMGNYITLTNMTQADIDRIIKMKTTPINVSVHTTNPELRCKMMKNRFAGKVLSYLDKLSDAGIDLNCQIVLCKGLNDGEELDRTLSDLVKLMPHLLSIAVVPVGLTKYREGLYPLEPFDKEDCRKVIGQVNAFGDECLSRYGRRLVYCSDEFYLKAEYELPDAAYYEGYPQLENGVGSIRCLTEEFYDEYEYLGDDYDLSVQRDLSIATGKAAYRVISTLTEALSKRCPNLHVHVYCVENRFYGENVTVAGLITAQDLIAEIKDKDLGDTLLLPSVMINADGLFLDGVRLDEVEKELGVKIVLNDCTGADFIRKILGSSD